MMTCEGCAYSLSCDSILVHVLAKINLQSYTIIYVNTQIFLFLMQLYFVLGDMFRLIIQPSSGQLTIERYLTILRPIWDPTSK